MGKVYTYTTAQMVVGAARAATNAIAEMTTNQLEPLPTWEELPGDAKARTVRSVIDFLAGLSPQEVWEKRVKEEEKKLPGQKFVGWDQMDEAVKISHYFFQAVVLAMARTLKKHKAYRGPTGNRKRDGHTAVPEERTDEHRSGSTAGKKSSGASQD